jgi:hypothetical protein
MEDSLTNMDLPTTISMMENTTVEVRYTVMSTEMAHPDQEDQPDVRLVPIVTPDMRQPPEPMLIRDGCVSGLSAGIPLSAMGILMAPFNSP